MSKTPESLDVLLIADDGYRVSMLRESMRQSGLSCTIRRMDQTRKASAYVRKLESYGKSPRPDLVLFDLAEPSEKTLEVLRDVAFGEQRSEVPVVLMTSPASEPLLESGEIDDGRATMFSPRALPSLLGKLVGSRRQGFLRALGTLYQYGPILARQPAEFLDRRDDYLQLSA